MDILQTAMQTLTLAGLALALYLLLGQYGRILHRLDAIEEELILARVSETAFGPSSARQPKTANTTSQPDGDPSLAKSRLRRDGLQPGEPAPSFEISTPDRLRALSLDDYRGSPLLLVFSDTDCAPCAELWPALARASTAGGSPQILMVSRGDPERVLERMRTNAVMFQVGMQEHWELSREYAIFRVPCAYLIDDSGRISKPLAVGPAAILQLAGVMESADASA